ncbi:Abhydrolase domain-containing protein mpaH [Hypsizygus marmoreus]|uniref:Abhydrolase domain-containing protein mpaH n=1 Tax=Hypsizygus marmoreus TaxID=39966 RepID=A0A369J5F3_HYPMA|nr:Abhydrolase domain-containing protein mpaH [Hypsizygus marmoreus]
MSDFQTATIRLDPQPGSYPLHVLANWYRPKAWLDDEDGYTFVLLHAVGMHKETWETTIEHLFELSTGTSMIARSPFKIRDVFSIESPNHGESAVLNEVALKEHFGDSWPTRATAAAVHQFLTAGVTRGAKVDFTKRKLVGIGHSIGAAALFLLRDETPRVQFESIIAIEPGISVKELPETKISSQALTAWTWLRRDVWSSRSAAKKELLSTPVHQTWDPRELDLYVKYALRIHPAKAYAPPFSFNGVTTCLTKEQEAASYRSEHLVVDAMEAYTATTREIPVHLVFGTIHDVGTPGLQQILSDKTAGRTPASVTYVEGAGHLAVQQKPEDVAEAIFAIMSVPPRAKGRL